MNRTAASLLLHPWRPVRRALRGPIAQRAGALLLGITLALPLPVLALSGDSDKPINLEADQAELNEATGVSTYTGRVVLTQGSIELHADRLVVHAAGGELSQITATGNPVRFRQRPEGRNKDVTAEAKKLEYQGKSRMLVLIGEAKVTQGRNTFRGQRIEYDLQRESVLATGGSGEGGKPGRVQMTIVPSKGGDDKQ